MLSFWYPASYRAYRWVRAPVKRLRAQQALTQLGFADLENMQDFGQYRLKDYVWPLALASFLTFIGYGLTHPFVIQSGLWAGVLEEIIDVFGAGDIYPNLVLLSSLDKNKNEQAQEINLSDIRPIVTDQFFTKNPWSVFAYAIREAAELFFGSPIAVWA